MRPPRYWHAEQFLDSLNNRVRMTAEGEICIRTPRGRDERDAGFCDGEFVFREEIDIVVKGYCTLEESEDDRFQLYNAIDGLKLPSILMLATCCSGYDEEFQKILCTKFPHNTWFFPDMSGLECDFGTDEGAIEAARCLVKAGIIVLADSDS